MPSILRVLAVSSGLTIPLVAAAAAREVVVGSPDGQVQFHLSDQGARLSYRVTYKTAPALAPSDIGITVDGVNLAEAGTLGPAETYAIDTSYPWHGAHSTAFDKCNGARITVTHPPSRTSYTLDVRAYDDGVAFRHVVPGTGPRIPDEATSFVLPATSRVWFHDLEDFYEGVHKRRRITAVQPGAWAAPPVTFQVTDRGPYGAITESGLLQYSGMALQGDGENGFRARLAHAHPITWIWRWDFKDKADEKRVQQPAVIEGTITTPWRVVLLAADLNALVNSDLVHNVADPPDPKLFPKGAATDWIRPGRAVWAWSDGGNRTLEGMKEFSRLAGELGYEYNILEGFWSRWPEAHLKELADYSRERGVRILLWKHRRQLKTRGQVVEFAELCRRVGAAGAKVDALNHEHKEVIDLQETILLAFAERELIVDLHGTGKPAGQERTYPHLLGYEGIRGMEASPPWAQHNVTLPFTRMVAGLGDYTPVHFGADRGDTTWAHQVANAVILGAPLLVYAAHPANILANPARDILKSIPPVWDETIVLPPSAIGEVAAFARRKGDTWFVAITNGPNSRDLTLDLSFLAPGSYQALLIREGSQPDSVKIEAAERTPRDTLSVHLPSGGGFVQRFSKIK